MPLYDNCVRCGLCLPSCPTYLETMTETSGPRGRISLMKDVAEGRLDLLSEGFVHQMSECLDCRACAAACPSGVQYGSLIEGARAEIAAAHGPKRSLAQRLIRWFAIDALFGHLWLMRVLAVLLRVYQRCGLQAWIRKSGLLHRAGMADVEALTPEISDRFFVPRGQRFESPNEHRVVMLLAGCVMQVAFAGVDEATVRVLQRNGCTVVVPAAQGCCGAIAIHAGETAFGRTLAKRNIEAFEASGASLLVVNAAGCGSSLKEYAELLHDDPAWAARAADFSARVRDVLELLDEIGPCLDMGPVEGRVTYQEPCHLVHAQGIASAPRRLLQAIPGLQLEEMAESAVCCGSAGIYNLTQPAMSRRLGQRKAENVTATGAQIVATANPGCAMQLAAHLRARGATIEIKHVVELLDEAYGAYSVAASRSRSFSAASSVP